MGHFQILESAGICVLEYKRKPIEMTEFQWVLRNYRIDSGATSNRKSVCMALFLNKLYLYHDVSPLNKVFTALHRSTQVCILGTISECKDKHFLFYLYNYRVLIFALSISYINKLAKCNFCIASIFVIDIFSCALGFLICV